MRDTKSLLLLLVSLLLVIVSFGLLWTWGYRFYKNEEIKAEAKIVAVDSLAIAGKITDSLQKAYTTTLHELDMQLDSTLSNTDSLKSELDIKLGEFYRLRNEITTILKNRNNSSDFKVAKQKISELQNKVQDISVKNEDVEKENKKLTDVLNQLGNSNNKTDKNTRQTVVENKSAVEKATQIYPVFTASDIKFAALMIDDDKESETTIAEKADKLTGSFTVINYNSQLTNAQMVVVVLQPDGRVLKTSGWESGTFSTPEGKKVYSYKLNFSYSRGEVKRLLFSLQANKLVKGNYTMELYYNGLLIGKTVKTLS